MTHPADKPKRHCVMCGKALVKVGHRRMGGKAGRKDGDWRTLHVKCARLKYEMEEF